MSEPARSPTARYTFAAFTLVVGLVVSFVVPDASPATALIVFAGAVVAALWYGGPTPALLVLGASIVLINFFVLQPRLAFSVDPMSLLWLGLYAIVMYAMVWLFRRQTSETRVPAGEQGDMEGNQGFPHSVVNALNEHIAILDAEGNILAVNDAWRQFARENGPPGNGRDSTCYERDNYLEVCARATGPDAEIALAFAEGIRSVIRGERQEFTLEYPCHSPTDQRWFQGRVSRFDVTGRARVVVAHDNITARKLAELELRQQSEVIETVNRIGQMLSAELDMQKLVQAITDAATEVSQAEFGAFFYNVVDENDESFMLYAISGAPPEAFAKFPMPRNTHLFGPTFRGEGVVRADDVTRDGRYGKNSPYFGLPEGHLSVKSYLAVPVVSRSGQAIGGLFFGHSQPGVFGEREEKVVVGLAAQAAIAVDNARLYLETLKQAEQFEVTLTSIGDGVIAADDAGRITFMNRIAEELTGWLRPDATGKRLDDVFNIASLDGGAAIESPVTKIMRTGTVGPLERALLMTRGGGSIAIDHSEAPIRDESSEISGVVVVFRDVTKRKRLEEGLRFLVDANAALTSSLDYEATLQAVAQLAVPGIADLCVVHIVDGEDAIRHVGVMQQGQEKAASRGERTPFTDDPGVGHYYARVIRTGKPELIRGVDAVSNPAPAEQDGPGASVEPAQLKSAMCVPIKTPNGVIGAITFGITDSGRQYDEQDLILAEEIARRGGMAMENARLYETEREARREAELAAARISVLYAITSALSEAVTPEAVAQVIVDEALRAMGADIGIVCLLSGDSQALQLLTSTGIPAAVARAFETTPIEMEAPLNEALRQGRPLWIESMNEYESRFPQATDPLLFQSSSQSAACLPLIVHGKTIGGIGMSFNEQRRFTLQDRAMMVAVAYQCAQAIERARLFEAEQRARRAAEEADELKMKFLAMVSHELRTPLTSIKGFATTLLQTDVRFDSEDQYQFISIIDEESDKLQELIEQLLDLSRLQAGNLPIKPEAQPMTRVIETAMAQLMVLTQSHHLTIQLAPELPQVSADAQRVGQVLVNLVGNAAKYSPANTTITIQARPRNDSVQVDVCDEGPGIPLEARDYVFEAFRQVDGHARAKGAGLGLAICKGLIEAHGGQIWINDEAARGTIISFTLPVADPVVSGEINA